jgi:hypothetical protein
MQRQQFQSISNVAPQTRQRQMDVVSIAAILDYAELELSNNLARPQSGPEPTSVFRTPQGRCTSAAHAQSLRWGVGSRGYHANWRYMAGQASQRPYRRLCCSHQSRTLAREGSLPFIRRGHRRRSNGVRLGSPHSLRAQSDPEIRSPCAQPQK